MKYFIVIICLFFSSCITLDISNTYIDSKLDLGDFGFFEGIKFYLQANTKIENGSRLGDKRYKYSEPYNLHITFLHYTYGRKIKKLTINAIYFSKNNEPPIDIRTNFKPFYNSIYRVYNTEDFYAFNHDDALLYHEQGIIYVSTMNETQRELISKNNPNIPLNEINNNMEIRLSCENIDVVYRNDKRFKLELDITFEYLDGKIEDKNIELDFKRKRKKDRVNPLMLFLAWALSE